MTTVHPILLAGGSGTRLWPLSRKSYPKQFASMLWDKTLFQQTALRLTSSKQLKFAPQIILTNSDFRFIVADQLQAVGVTVGPVLIEPEAKNTAPAILAASLLAQKNDPDAIVLAAPSDHLIPDTANFHEAITIGMDHVTNGKMVTFGISPTHPETGYGYLKLAKDNLDSAGSSSVTHFVEKPEYSQAKKC